MVTTIEGLITKISENLERVYGFELGDNTESDRATILDITEPHTAALTSLDHATTHDRAVPEPSATTCITAEQPRTPCAPRRATTAPPRTATAVDDIFGNLVSDDAFDNPDFSSRMYRMLEDLLEFVLTSGHFTRLVDLSPKALARCGFRSAHCVRVEPLRDASFTWFFFSEPRCAIRLGIIDVNTVNQSSG